jgi:1,4-alpha-glucan branching enzyme
VTVRAWHPDATGCECVLLGDVGAPGEDGVADVIESMPRVPLAREAPGVFAAFLPGETLPLRYRLRYTFANGGHWLTDDPYRFLPTVGALDLHLFGEGTHRRLWEAFGAHARTVDGTEGVSFAVWAPNARRVSVVGPWCQWDAGATRCAAWAGAACGSCSSPASRGRRVRVRAGDARGAGLRRKTDPFAFQMRPAPATQSVVAAEGAYAWGDGAWMARAPAATSRASRWPSTSATSARGCATRRARTGAQLPRGGAAAGGAREAGWASRTSSSCRSPSTRSTARGATRSRASTRPPRATARPTTCASSSTRCTRPGSA